MRPLRSLALQRVIAGACTLAGVAFPAAAQGYRVDADRLVVDADDWGDWQAPPGTAHVDAEGVRPARIAGATLATASATILAAGSDAVGAANAIDGDPETFWQPDIDGPPRSWWLEIDLGRMVNATRIVLRFAEEVEGDPFYQFNVLVSDGTTAFAGSQSLAYARVGRNDLPNTNHQRFEVELAPRRPADSQFVGDPVRYVMVQLTDSRGRRAEEVTADTWSRLPDDQQGAVDYYREEASGQLRLIDADQYGVLSEANRGPIRSYRRERPRLSEVEVLTAGENLGLGILAREGRLEGFGNLGSEVLTVDGDFNTSWATPSAYASPVEDPERSLFVDLGTTYWLERLHFLYNVTPASGPFPNYVMRVSDGSRAPDGSLVWTPVSARGVGDFEVIGRAVGEDDTITEFQSIVFPPTRTRFFRLDYLVQVFFGCSGLGCSASVREIQFYGGGFLPHVVLRSPLIELGDRPLTLGALTWEAAAPEGTALDIRTRSGNALAVLVRYFNSSGGEVTEERYRGLLSFQRGDTLSTAVAGPDWSGWSQRYEHSGEVVSSPSPRRYLQLEVTMRADDPELAPRLRSLAVRLEAPLAARLVAEMTPLRIEKTGVDELFTLYVRPGFEGADPGFDQLLVAGPPGAILGIVDATVGTEEALAAAGGESLDVDTRATGSDTLWIDLPRRLRTDDQLLAVRFHARLFGAGNPFAVAAGARIDDGTRWQQADGGEATTLVDGRGLNVLAPFAEDLVRQVEVRPPVFSPNGDGVNDEVSFVFSVFKVAVEKSTFAEIFDLTGRRVRRLEAVAVVPIGERTLSWDGRDDEGRRVPPGLYVARFGLDVDASNRSGSVTRTVAVAY